MARRVVEECDECGREFETEGTLGGKESHKSPNKINVDTTRVIAEEDEGRWDTTIATIKVKGDICNECLKNALIDYLKPFFTSSRWTEVS